MTFLKGYKTLIFNIATTLVALGEMTDVFNIIAPQYTPAVLIAVAVGNIILRFFTTTPIGSKI